MIVNATFEQVQQFKEKFQKKYGVTLSGCDRLAFQAFIPQLESIVGVVRPVKLDIFTTEKKSWAQCTVRYRIEGMPVVMTFSTRMMGSSALLKTLSEPIFRIMPTNFITC